MSDALFTEVPSDTVLQNSPERVMQFLRGVGASKPIRVALKSVGWTPKDHDEGWTRFFKAVGYDPIGMKMIDDSPAPAAIRELDAWDESAYRRAEAALLHRFPKHAEFVFHDLAPSKGMPAVIGVAKFLDRLDAMEKGEEPVTTHEEDLQAIEFLASRGFTKKDRDEKRELVKVALSAPAPTDEPTSLEAARTDLLACHRWWLDWSESAHTVIDNRRLLILLGIARRQPRKTDKEVDGPAAPTGDAVPTPVQPT